MSEKFGNLTTTSIDPNMFGGSGGNSGGINSSNPNNSPSFFEGTEISIVIEELEGGITSVSGGCYGESGPYVTQKYKVGDIYFNTDEQRSYQCVYSKFDDTKTHKEFYHDWIILGGTDVLYDSESLNPQSGFAVATALESKQSKLSAGDGIEIDEENVISAQLKANLEPKQTLVRDLNALESHRSSNNLEDFIGYWNATANMYEIPDYPYVVLGLYRNGKSEWLLTNLDESYLTYFNQDGLIKIEGEVWEDVHITPFKDVSDKADKSEIGDIGAALDEIIALQNSILGGE